MRSSPHVFRNKAYFGGWSRWLAVAVALLLTVAPVLAQGTQASRVRILLAADTDAPGAAQFGLGLDGTNMKRVFDELFLKADKSNRYTLDLYTGEKCSPTDIMNYYQNLKSNPTETLVFYYTGHGVMTKNGHMITTHKGFIPRKMLMEAMQKHNPQLVVLLIDCCANFVGGKSSFNPRLKTGLLSQNPIGHQLLAWQNIQPPTIDDRLRPKISEAPPAPPISQGKDDNLLTNLFFEHKGLVDLNAAESGKSASGNAGLGGSYFTVALAQELRKNVTDIDLNSDGFVEWREFMPPLSKATVAAAAKAGFFQQPEAFSPLPSAAKPAKSK